MPKNESFTLDSPIGKILVERDDQLQPTVLQSEAIDNNVLSLNLTRKVLFPSVGQQSQTSSQLICNTANSNSCMNDSGKCFIIK